MTKVEKIPDYNSRRPTSKKDRRHSGWVYPHSTLRCPKQYIIDNCLEPEPYWNDWAEHRDGFRDWLNDGKKIKNVEYKCCGCPDLELSDKEEVLMKLCGIEKHICPICEWRKKWNKKQKKLLKIRLAMKHRTYINTFI